MKDAKGLVRQFNTKYQIMKSLLSRKRLLSGLATRRELRYGFPGFQPKYTRMYAEYFAVVAREKGAPVHPSVRSKLREL